MWSFWSRVSLWFPFRPVFFPMFWRLFQRHRLQLVSLLLWTPTHGRAKAGRPARTYIQQLCEDTGCCPEDLPEAMNDREKWRNRVRDIRATSTTWWWWWWWSRSWVFLLSGKILVFVNLFAFFHFYFVVRWNSKNHEMIQWYLKIRN